MPRRNAVRLFRETLQGGYARVEGAQAIRKELPLFFFPDVEAAYTDAVQRLRQRSRVPNHNTRRQLSSHLRTWRNGQVNAKQVIARLQRCG
jgi:hypothetical protein